MAESPVNSDSQTAIESSSEMKFSDANASEKGCLPTPGSPPPLMTAEDYFRNHNFAKVLLPASDAPGAPSDVIYSVPQAHSGVLLQTALRPPILRMCTTPANVMTLVPLHSPVTTAAWRAPPWSPHVITAGTFSPPVSAPLPPKTSWSCPPAKRSRPQYNGRFAKQRTASESTASSGYQSAYDNESEIDCHLLPSSTFKATAAKRRNQTQRRTARPVQQARSPGADDDNKRGHTSPPASTKSNRKAKDQAQGTETDSVTGSVVVSTVCGEPDVATNEVVCDLASNNECRTPSDHDEHIEVDVDCEQIKRFICNVCCKAFQAMAELLQHHKRQHLQTRPYRCDRCPRAFQHPYSLRVHRRSQHNDLDACTMFACKHCGKEFASAASLRVHARMHTGERPYACEMCDKTFMRSHQLKMHVRIHTGTKPHRCGVCSKAFTQFKYLKEHCQRHARFLPYKCEVCQKAFLRPSHLSKHRRVHSQESAIYPCGECKETFTHMADLQKHLEKQHRSQI